MTDTEKKIAELLDLSKPVSDCPDCGGLGEIGSLGSRRKCECLYIRLKTLKRELDMRHEVISELSKERDMYKSSSEVFYERLKILDELLEQLRAQIKYYFGGDGGLAKLQDGVNKLLQERQRLIDGLLAIMNIASEDGVHWKLDRCYTMARDILKEMGVLSK